MSRALGAPQPSKEGCESKSENMGAAQKKPAQVNARRKMVRDEGKAHPSNGKIAVLRKPPTGANQKGPSQKRQAIERNQRGSKEGYPSPKRDEAQNFREQRDPNPGKWTTVAKKRSDRELVQLRLLVKNQTRLINEMKMSMQQLVISPRKRRSLPQNAAELLGECTEQKKSGASMNGSPKFVRKSASSHNGRKSATPSSTGIAEISAQGAAPMKPTGQRIANSKCHQDTKLPFMVSTVSDVKDSSPAPINRPKTGGSSLSTNQLEIKSQQEVSFVPERVFVSRDKLSKKVKNMFRKGTEFVTDRDLHFYLVLEFAMVPRSQELLRQMVLKAKNYLQRFDLLGMTNESVYKLVMGAVRSAMLVPPEEEGIRSFLKNPAAMEEMYKQSKLLNHGDAGTSFSFFRKTRFQLPSSK